MMDMLSKQLSLTLVTDFSDVKGTQLFVFSRDIEDPTKFIEVPMSTKLGELGNILSQFEQGDTLIIHRGKDIE
jgi:hypothetical protein